MKATKSVILNSFVILCFWGCSSPKVQDEDLNDLKKTLRGFDLSRYELSSSQIKFYDLSELRYPYSVFAKLDTKDKSLRNDLISFYDLRTSSDSIFLDSTKNYNFYFRKKLNSFESANSMFNNSFGEMFEKFTWLKKPTKNDTAYFGLINDTLKMSNVKWNTKSWNGRIGLWSKGNSIFMIMDFPFQ